ncbi:MAG: thiamine diphosphokinase [Lachnospiraceae bacterium]|nr:thiamine diphosphokinase [Lachnospiraceae bacterium]
MTGEAAYINDKDCCLIITGGSYDGCSPADRTYGLIIACDKGYEYSERLGIKPQVLVSDFDSFDGEVDKDVIVERHPSVKNDTDTQLAVKYALGAGYTCIDILYALGGRKDHEYANYQTGIYAAKRGTMLRLVSKDQEIFFLPEGTKDFTIKPEADHCFSVFSATERCEGVYIKNAAYELNDAVLTFDSAGFTGQSNEFLKNGDDVKISVSKGILIVMITGIFP